MVPDRSPRHRAIATVARVVLALLAATLLGGCRHRARIRPRAALTTATSTALARPAPPPALDRCDPVPACPPVTPPVAPQSLPQWSRIEALLARGNGDGSIDPAELNLLIAQALDPSVDVQDSLRELDAMAAVIRARLPERCDHRCRVRAINHYLFTEQGFRSEFDPSDLYLDVTRDRLDRVLATRVGYCEGLSYLYLALGRRVGVPLAAVSARRHMYVRYVGDEGAPYDIDPTQEGRAPLRVPGACQASPGVYDATLDDRTMAGELLGLVAIAGGFASPAWLDRAVELAPRSPELRNNRGLVRAQRLDAEGALEDYHAARELDPCSTLYAMNEARLLWGQGRRTEAGALLDEYDRRTASGRIAEGQFLVTLVRASFAFETGDDAAADQWLYRALEQSDGAPVALEALAAARVVQGHADEAVRAMRVAVLADPSARTRVGLVLALLENGDAQAAEAQLTRVAREPGAVASGSLDLHIAMVAAARGRTDEAEAAARRCLQRLGQRCARALVVLGDVAHWRGQDACARQYYDAFLACPVPVPTRGLLRVQAEVRERAAQVGGEGARRIAAR